MGTSTPWPLDSPVASISTNKSSRQTSACKYTTAVDGRSEPAHAPSMARKSDHAIRLVQQSVDVGHGLARLRGHVPRMNGFVADDARGAGDEQIRPRRFAQHTGAREDRAVPAELRRIVIGAGLPGIFYHLRRPPRSQEVNGYGAARRRAQ